MGRTLAMLHPAVVCVLAGLSVIAGSPAQAQTYPSSFKVAFYNIESGNGSPTLPGGTCAFTKNQNCTDPTQPLNAWGRGIVQDELRRQLGADPKVVALALSEAYGCATPRAIRDALGWAAHSSARNGTAIVARHGFAGPETWIQLDTSGNINPNDTKWVLRVPVCLNASCTRSVVTFTAHWFGYTALWGEALPIYERQARQTLDFMGREPVGQPHLLLGDLNAYEGTWAVCAQEPQNSPIRMLREAGYLDAWPAVHARAEGFTAMWNRLNCGQPHGYLWKRIDYIFSRHMNPLTMRRFGMVQPGQCAPSDHAGIIVEYQMPGGVPGSVFPVTSIRTPDGSRPLSGTTRVLVDAVDDDAVRRVELFVNGVVVAVMTAAPYQFDWDTRGVANGTYTLQAAATDSSGNRAVSGLRSVIVHNPSGPGDEVVLHARDAAVIAGNWSLVPRANAAGGQALRNRDQGLERLSSALASPRDYFEMTFTANAGKPYRLWIRGAAEGNSSLNDAVFVQFDGAVNASGSPVYRIGTTGATAVNIEECAGCRLSGWGWQDNGFGRDVLGPVIYFASSGQQRLRVQRREDGLDIDQIVLSAVAYLHTAPGAMQNDTTVLPRTGGTGSSPPPPAPPPAPAPDDEVVLYASRAPVRVGEWTVVNDTSAAGGARLQGRDAGAPRLATPLASPVHYFEMTFNAVAGKPYRLWIRGRALNDDYNNDSVYVQFDRSVDASGAPRWRIGTTSATTIVLEDCHGCRLNGWGWQDNGYGIGVLGPTVYFATSGPQRIRLQTREDGLGIDQIVLSAARYLTSAPGPPTRDTTILPALPAAAAEVVLHTARATAIVGDWTRVTDTTAASGIRLQNPDRGAAKLIAPLASPVHYFELAFEAEAGKPYRLWLRGRAQQNHYDNDSIFVQFDGSVNAAGSPIWRIGTTSATTVVLEDCNSCGLSGWGWQDNGYGTGVLGPVVYFARSGPQRLRIQVREDGLGIDQVVLSSARYLTAAPGPTKNDATILP